MFVRKVIRLLLHRHQYNNKLGLNSSSFALIIIKTLKNIYKNIEKTYNLKEKASKL